MSTKQNSVRALLVVGIIGVFAVGVTFALKGDEADAPPTPGAKTSGTMTLGAADAPITVIEYSDFQCPFCAVFARDIQPQLIEQYVDTGLVRFEWRNFPIFGQFSNEAALGSYCADDQGAFWPYHDTLYETVGALAQGDKNIDTLVNIAAALDLDTTEFRACIEDGRHNDRVRADYAEGRALNIVGTPSFTINGMLMVGAQPVDTWQQVFEALSE